SAVWSLISVGAGCLGALSSMLPKKHHPLARKVLFWLGIGFIVGGIVLWRGARDSSVNGAQTNKFTGTIGSANGSIIAPGATGPITQYNNVPLPLPESEIEQIKQLDAFFAGRDE